MGRLPQRAAATLPSSFCHQDGQILTDLRKGGKVDAVHHLMVQAARGWDSWSRDICNGATQRHDGGAQLPLSCGGMAPPTLKVLSSANPIQKPLGDTHWRLSPTSTISFSHRTQVGQCSQWDKNKKLFLLLLFKVLPCCGKCVKVRDRGTGVCSLPSRRFFPRLNSGH